MKTILIILLLFCVQVPEKLDSTKVQTPVKMFFEQRDTQQITKDINYKLDLLLVKLEAMNDSTKIK